MLPNLCTHVLSLIHVSEDNSVICIQTTVVLPGFAMPQAAAGLHVHAMEHVPNLYLSLLLNEKAKHRFCCKLL